jgi:hypothetical protein
MSENNKSIISLFSSPYGKSTKNRNLIRSSPTYIEFFTIHSLLSKERINLNLVEVQPVDFESMGLALLLPIKSIAANRKLHYADASCFIAPFKIFKRAFLIPFTHLSNCNYFLNVLSH